jgi:hypothetical protein
MGILDKILGKGQNYPPLDPASPAASRLSAIQQLLEPFVKQVSDRLEIVPLDREAVVFIGKPPDAFGAAWVHDGKISNFKTLMQEKKLPADQFQLVSDRLRDAYVRSRETDRFSAAIGGKTIVVTPSESLERDVTKIFQELGA